MDETDLAIVGGGIAGAALAFHLARAGADVHLLERAPRLGAHASGRNARLVLQPSLPPLVRELTAKSAHQLAGHAEEMGFTRTGSLLLAGRATLEVLRDDGLFASELLDGTAPRRRAPSLQTELAGAALFTPGDGVLDAERLLAFYVDGARTAGARVDLGREVTSIAPGGAPFTLTTPAGPVRAARVVDAAGAWATEVAASAGATALPLVAFKRHLFLLDGEMPAGEPYVWDLTLDVYYRHDREGILACMCDEEGTAELVETVSQGAEEELRRKLAGAFPWIAEARVRRAWSCFRTKAADALPVIGPDPRLPGFWWLAGLAGYGMGASWEIGRIAARALLEGEATLPPAVLPSRLAG